ncbi:MULTISPECIES: 6,7-dimethyl-8-ribityllumazine synthase [unclassified Corynebacterium]|uniref:6,7-dimethyl-8-ribityllumazine synthase n=1 Tax=unclassified Corynebacterium TaxID=2624378 RepID=UPI0021A9DC7A|nr:MULTISPECIES: 6,7-dimethyl-8-ribityllumazine synthase [unclassified Corynebacterium]MCT1452385.1 6,7-dimethyl-8-ribityllumazine synthase [Corynebacterium sp. p3-SID1145]MCT1461219.1 6,7-dimethyl-8-ribityllumazine synthase [Corynebacterium sp. p3-SID1140]MDN8593916.1 6,7-dimethyl-8-ribityllumazine synthase [Corynebacterium sp. P4_F2]WKK56017.1 6,7-dimethyl-8-ribityllumazine synthase [Corynebacterium sp. P4-C1]
MIFGAPDSSPDHLDAEGMRVAVVGTEWNAEVVDMLTKRAVETAEAAGAEVQIFTVSGAMELPLMAQAAAKRFDAVVALGCVIRGETPHFDYVCRAVTDGLTRVTLDSSVPVGNGVLTVDTYDQAVARTGGPNAREDKGAEAIAAAIGAANVMRDIEQFPLMKLTHGDAHDAW